MIGSAARVQYSKPITLVWITSRHWSVAAPSIGPSRITPALLTRASEAVAGLLDEGACLVASPRSVMIASALEPTYSICSASAVASSGQMPRQ
jgi:hypothetical protein